ncbi:MAG: nucleotidyltransferase family protein [Chloroflexi bacterium]|nr:nucleotidyltransferase family protein [Chloroflexota bacterium]
MSTDELLKQKREEILRIAARHGVTRVRVFGSAARGEATDQSDIDFLIDVEGPTTPWFPGGLVADLEEALGRRVDVVEPDAIRRELRERVLEEAVSL